MKKYILISVIFAMIHLGVSGQEEMHNMSLLIDKAPLDVFDQPPSTSVNREIWDLQFEFPVGDTTQGIETDGEFIYITNYRNVNIRKYDFQGNIIESFSIPGVSKLNNLAYDGQYFYGSKGTDSLFVMDFYSKTLIDIVRLSFALRGVAYNPDENLFYGNNWGQAYIYVFKPDGEITDSIMSVETGWTYDYAYDGWSEGGPYLWGFSQYGVTGYPTQAILTQYSLDTKEPTGFNMDLAYLASDPSYVFAGGIFTHQNIISETVTIGGLIQNDLVFGLELDSIYCEAPQNLSAEVDNFDVYLTWSPPETQQFFIIGYNIYRNDTLITYNPVSDTNYLDQNLPYGTHSYHVTALYQDDLGYPGCESNPSQGVEVNIEPPAITLGGNVIAGQDKMYYGHVNAFQYENQKVTETYSSIIIDTLGYYFFLPFVNKDYYIHATPKVLSVFANNYAPTYFGDKLHWEDAQTVFLENSIYNANIDMTALTSMESGYGIIQGNISHQSISYLANPAADVLVLLLNESNECIAYINTDQDGNFLFNNLPAGTFDILIEVVGKEMNPASFTLINDISSITDISFVIADGEILMGVEETLPHYVNFISEIFPNPAKIKTHIEINSSRPAQISTSLFDTRSKIIFSKQEKLNTGTNRVYLNLETLPPGVYYYQISFEDGHSIIRKVLILR